MLRARSRIVLSQRRTFADDTTFYMDKYDSAQSMAGICNSLNMMSRSKLLRIEPVLKSIDAFEMVTGRFFNKFDESADTPDQRKMGVIMLGDKGMCGRVNSQMIRLGARLFNDHPLSYGASIGQRGKRALLNHSRFRFLFEGADKGAGRVVYDGAVEISDKLSEVDVDEITFYHHEFINQSTQTLSYCLFYGPQIGTPDIMGPKFANYELEGDNFTTVYEDLRAYAQTARLWKTMVTQSCSEFASRVNSMTNASSACEENAKEYYTLYQMARQQTVTVELFELLLGADDAIDTIGGVDVIDRPDAEAEIDYDGDDF